jgi:hypothetical protein
MATGPDHSGVEQAVVWGALAVLLVRGSAGAARYRCGGRSLSPPSFEDLDRHNNAQIFEALRELNTLLNNTPKWLSRAASRVRFTFDVATFIVQTAQTNSMDINYQFTVCAGVCNPPRCNGSGLVTLSAVLSARYGERGWSARGWMDGWMDGWSR